MNADHLSSYPNPLALPEEDCETNNHEISFNQALAELRRYSESQGIGGWSCPEPEISEFGGAYQVFFFIPKIVPKSVKIAFEGDTVIVSGLRWAAPPGARCETQIPFTRNAVLPESVIKDHEPTFSHNDESLIMLLPKQGAVERFLRDLADAVPNGRRRPVEGDPKNPTVRDTGASHPASGTAPRSFPLRR